METSSTPTQPAATWRDGAFVTLPRAAEILGYAVGSIRRIIFCGGLDAVRLTRGGPMLVTVSSLAALVDSAEPVPAAKAKPLPRTSRRGRGRLQLVVDNP